MKAFKFTDTDGSKWKVWVRGWYQDKITGARKLKEYKQKAADERRERGQFAHATAIEHQTIIRWAVDSGVFSKKVRIV